MKFDVITIGSATRDVYIQSKDLIPAEGEEFATGKGFCITSGSKLDISDIHFTTGGSAMNTAVTFAQQGFKTALIAKVGNDSRGNSIKKRAEDVGISTELMNFDNELLTAYSVVIHTPGDERTIFVYRGASSRFDLEEFDLGVLNDTKWIYVSHLAEDAAQLFEPLLKEASEKGVKVGLNPGSTQLNMGEELVPLLKNVDILFVNQEEASMLTGIEYKKENEVFEKLNEWMRGIAVMTKGPEGVTVSDGENRWDAGILKEPKFVDRTGAGDAFASGFTAAIMRGEGIEEAILLGSANATNEIGVWGANHGLLTKDDSSEKFGKLEIKQSQLK